MSAAVETTTLDAPWREVAGWKHIPGGYRLWLECGHSERRGSTLGRPVRVRCSSCLYVRSRKED